MARPTKHKDGSREARARAAGVSPATIARRDAANEIPDQDLVNEQRRAAIVKTQAEGDRQVRLLEILDQEFVKRSVVEEHGATLALIMNQVLQAVRTELPGVIAGLGEAEAEVELIRFTDAWEDRLRDANDSIWTKAREAVVQEMRGDLRRAAKGSRARPE